MPSDRLRSRALLTVLSLSLSWLTCLAFAAEVQGRPAQTSIPEDPEWDPESGLGNHRAEIEVGAGPVARAVIPWRRRDLDPEKKNLIVVDATTGARIRNVIALTVNREFGDIVFETKTVPGDYYVYYMPYKSEGRKNYPNVKYDPPQATADPAWLAATGLGPGAVETRRLEALPRAKFLRIRSVDDFSMFTMMEEIATAAEVQALLARNPGAAYLIFPEDPTLSIRMTDDLPRHWTDPDWQRGFQVDGYYGDYATFQIGVWAAREAIEDLEVKFSDFAWRPFGNETGDPSKPAVIPASALTCFNTGGIDWDGRAFKKKVAIDKGKVQALWCGVQIPPNARFGIYEGTVTVAPKGLPANVTALPIYVGMEPRLSGWSPYDNPYHMARLRWLDSTLAQDDTVVPPYTPLTVEGRTVGCLGRTLTVGADGLPARITSSFAPEMTRFQAEPAPLTAAPMRLVVADAGERELNWVPAPGGPGPRPVVKGPGAVVWETENRAGDLVMKVAARMEFDGFVDYKIAITARRDTAVSDIRLEVHYREDSARYMMGLGFKGGVRPRMFEWSWDQKKNQDALWLGAVNAGIQVGLRAENYSRPLNTNFYLSKPLNMPPSWWNEGKGKVTVRTEGLGTAGGAKAGGAVVMRATSGPRTIRAGETLHFDFTLLITPFKPLDPAAHFGERYYHAFKPVDEIAATGANVINVHHANAINP